MEKAVEASERMAADRRKAMQEDLDAFFQQISDVVADPHTDSQLQTMIEGTRGAYRTGEISLDQVRQEAALNAELKGKLQRMQQTTTELVKRNDAAKAIWATRDTRWGKDETGSSNPASETLWSMPDPVGATDDEVKQLIQDQAEEHNQMLSHTQLSLHAAERERAGLHEIIQQMTSKNLDLAHGQDLDTSSLALPPQPGMSPSKFQGSKTTHQDVHWHQSTRSLVQRATDQVATSTNARKTAYALSEMRMDLEAAAVTATVNALEVKVEHWKVLCDETLIGRVHDSRQQLADFDQIFMQLPGRKRQLAEAALKAETRIGKRNARPGEERKHDDAERALVQELANIRALQGQFQEKEDCMHSERKRIKAELGWLESELEAARLVRSIDNRCLQQERALLAHARMSHPPLKKP